MNEERLTPEERALLEAQKRATPVPWKAWPREDYDPARFLTYRQHTTVGKEGAAADGGPLGFWTHLGTNPNDREDAAYIVAAANAVPGLLRSLSKERGRVAVRDAEIERLREAAMRMVGPHLTMPTSWGQVSVCRYCGNEYTGVSDDNVEHMPGCTWVGLQRALAANGSGR